MISAIEGDLVAVNEGSILLQCGHLTYALLVSVADEEQLVGKTGRRLRVHTLHYLESQGQGTSFVPRLIAFPTADARAFFELLTTAKGLGARKALRALRLPYRTIADAIMRKDAALLTSLPEIGKRTAETIVAELNGKVDPFAVADPDEGAEPETGPRGAIVRDAVAALTQLGEPKLHARRWVERALVEEPSIGSADELVAAAYRVRGDEPA